MTDLLANNCKSVGQPSSAKFNQYLGGQRAINSCSKNCPPSYTYDAKTILQLCD